MKVRQRLKQGHTWWAQAEEDWFRPYPDNLVLVSVSEYHDTPGKTYISIWGDGAFGMAIWRKQSFKEALRFTQRLPRPITVAQLERVGFSRI